MTAGAFEWDNVGEPQRADSQEDEKAMPRKVTGAETQLRV